MHQKLTNKIESRKSICFLFSAELFATVYMQPDFGEPVVREIICDEIPPYQPIQSITLEQLAKQERNTKKLHQYMQYDESLEFYCIILYAKYIIVLNTIGSPAIKSFFKCFKNT